MLSEPNRSTLVMEASRDKLYSLKLENRNIGEKTTDKLNLSLLEMEQ